jgi:alanine racemase
MGRLGTRAAAWEILAALSQIRHAHLEGLMTHFASAADYTSTQTVEQLTYFHTVSEELRRAGVNAAHLHTSSTNAIGYSRVSWHNMVRAGHPLYGYVSPAAATFALPLDKAHPHMEGQTAGRKRHRRPR